MRYPFKIGQELGYASYNWLEEITDYTLRNWTIIRYSEKYFNISLGWKKEVIKSKVLGALWNM